MKKAVIYIHGKGGNAAEAEHYFPLFPDAEVMGFSYHAQTPWEAVKEFSEHFTQLEAQFDSIVLIANSIGACFALNALSGRKIQRAYFISPVVNMERLILDMMQWAGVSEEELRKQGTIETAFGETLSWAYLTWVRSHPITWKIPTAILYGSDDSLQSMETIRTFAEEIGAELTVMPHGEHWFHTEEQMRFLDNWLMGAAAKAAEH